ncbi:uncharacterized protein JCM6883_003725 [Sporobolomyces salmoneus]|uniref:uncharacterized protein n=1 Tax=Sporobolomyces salmoneus TaxID=183962 RepID=UPI003179C992
MATTTNTTTALSELDRELAEKRKMFLEDFENGNSKNWIIVMGNEAGDLDSLASSIAYSYFASRSSSPSSASYIPLQLTPRSDFYLRPENLESLDLSSISPASLLTIDDLSSPSTLESKFVLVDHNSLLPAFRTSTTPTEDDGRVLAIIDHHVDEEQHLSANPRIISLIGSCSSLVVNHFLPTTATTENKKEKDVPRGLADLLISSVLIDTRLKPIQKGGKATPQDLEAVSRLIPYSSFSNPTPGEGGGGEVGTLSEEEVMQGLKLRGEKLSDLKEDVSWMNGWDLLRRDYKEYITDSTEGIKYGLSTVPLGFNVWLDKFEEGSEVSGLLEDVRAWMRERGLKLCGVLTSYTHIKKKTGEEGKHRRELLVLTNERRFDVVFEGLEGEEVLELGKWKEAKNYGDVDQGETDEGVEWERWKVWQQGNTKATRKVVAPVLKELVHRALEEK